MNETIHFKKQRELGTILTDIFRFIRLEWRPLLGLIAKTAGPALLILIVAYMYYMQSIFGTMGVIERLETMEFLGTTSVFAILFFLISAIVYYSLLNGVVLHYVKSYIKNNGMVSQEEVTVGVRDDFWILLGTSFVVGIIVGFGMLFCFIPGIYLGVVLSTAYAIVIFERRDIFDAIGYCFNLIKNEWWMTFATLLVIYLLYYFINMIFQVPQYIYFFVKGFSGSQTLAADPTMMFDWVYIVLTSIAMVFQYLMYTMIVLGAVFI